MAPKKKSNLFYNIFVGEYVIFITKLSTKKVQQTEDQIYEENTPIALEGFLLDMDDQYFYVGQDSDEVVSAIKRDEVIQVQITNPYDALEEALNSMPDPTDTEIN